MKSLSFLSASSTLLLSCSVIAFPFDVSLSSTQISSRAISSEQCQEVPSVIDPSCWITLKVAEHLTNWKKTTPRCKENGNGVGCCISTESFSTCYLRLALGVAGYECDTLNDNFCSSSILKPSGEQNPLLRAQQGYVIACIYEIRSFLQSYYQTLILDHTQNLRPIISAFKVQESPAPAALSAGLPIPLLLGLSVVKTTARNTSELQSIADRWSDALQDTPAVQQILWPTNATSNSQVLDLSNVTSADSVGSYLGDALKKIMSDVDIFQAFADKGRFATAEIPTVTSNIKSATFNLATGLYTYVTSKLMQENTYFASPGEVMDRTQFESDYCVISNYSSCKTERGNVFYWSPTTHRPYELRSKSVLILEFDELIRHFQDDGWANAQLLFDGAWNCTANGWAGGKITNPGVNGTVDVSCLSQLPMYYECGTPCPVDKLVGGKCPFGFTGC